MRLSNIQKESEKIKIKKSINEYEDLKSSALLKLGMMTFDKIRKNQVFDYDFNEICEEIKNYDIEIYQRYLELRSFENENKKITCECGYVAFNNERFCPKCGNNLEKEKMPSIICKNCNQKIDGDSTFCPCCGSKVKKIEYTYEETYFENESNKFDFYEDTIEDYILEQEKDSEEEIIELADEKKENSFLENGNRDF